MRGKKPPSAPTTVPVPAPATAAAAATLRDRLLQVELGRVVEVRGVEEQVTDVVDAHHRLRLQAGAVGEAYLIQRAPRHECGGALQLLHFTERHARGRCAQGKQAFPEQGVQLKAHLNTMERDLIRQALQHAGGNITKTAQLLHLQRTTLIQKMTKLRRESDQDEWPVLAASSGGN